MPSVSIVIPTCERWHLLGATLAGALGQQDVDLEVVVVNDGQSPPPAGMLEKDARVRLVVPREHRGVGHARNTGIAAASGEWVALLDDDDLWSPRKLSAQLTACAAAGSPWAYTAGLYVDEHHVPFELLPAPEPSTLLGVLYRHQVIPGAASNLLVRADLMAELGGFDDALHQLADWDLCLRLAQRALPAAVNELMLAYVQHGSSMLVTSRPSVFGEYDRFRAKHAGEARASGASFDPEAMGFWVVNRMEKAGHRGRAARESVAAGLHYREPALLVNALRLALRRSAAATPALAAEAEAQPPATPQWLADYDRFTAA
jgi:glycosyltransferase involved in cell wall biosynthesis